MSGEDLGAETRFFADIGEGAVAIVAIENRASVGGDEEVGEAIVVVVARGDAHAEGAAGDAGGPGHVGEGAVAVVLVRGRALRIGVLGL